MTPKQRAMLTLLKRYQRERGHAPKLVELAGLTGVTLTTAAMRLNALERMGLVERVQIMRFKR